MSQENILILIFSTCCLLVLGLHQSLQRGNQGVAERIKKMSVSRYANDSAKPARESKLILKQRLVGFAAKLLAPLRITRVVERALARADIPVKGEEFTLFAAAGILGCSLVAALLTGDLFLVVLTALFATIIPVLWVRMARFKRLAKFNGQLGDALVILSNCLRSGFSFLQAMDTVRREMPNPIAKEFGRTFQEMNLGTPTEEALANLAARVESEDLDLIITAVLIQRQVGGNLAEILDNIAHTIRERVRIKGEIKTLTAQGRMSGLIIGLLPIALAIVISAISPSYLTTLLSHQMGLAMIGYAVLMEILGVLMIKKIINIKV